MSSLVVRKEDAKQLPFYVGKRVENISNELKDAWDMKDYDAAYLCALGVDEEIEDLCIKYGANKQRILSDFCVSRNIRDPEAFYEAAMIGRKDILLLCKNLRRIDIQVAMEGAAWSGQNDIVLLCKDWGARDFDELAWIVAETGNLELLHLCKESGVTDFNYPMKRAALFNQDDAALLCKEFGATEFNTILLEAVSCSNIQAVRLSKKLGATDFTEAMIIAADQDDEYLIDLCLEYRTIQEIEI